MQAHDTHTMVKEICRTTSFQTHFFYNTFLYWLTNLLIAILSSIGKLFQVGKNKSTKQLMLKSTSFMQCFDKVTHGYNFSLLASFFLSGKICTNKHVYLNV